MHFTSLSAGDSIIQLWNGDDRNSSLFIRFYFLWCGTNRWKLFRFCSEFAWVHILLYEIDNAWVTFWYSETIVEVHIWKGIYSYVVEYFRKKRSKTSISIYNNATNIINIKICLTHLFLILVFNYIRFNMLTDISAKIIINKILYIEMFIFWSKMTSIEIKLNSGDFTLAES